MPELHSALQQGLAELAEGVVVADRNGTLVECSSRARSLLGSLADEPELRGFCKHELTNIATGQRCVYEDLPPVRALAGESPAKCALALGSERARVLELRSAVLRDAAGAIVGCVTVLRDISQEYAQLCELRDDRRFLDSIIENIPDMVFVKDAEKLRFQRFNRAGEQLLGMLREQLLGKTDYDFFPPEQAAFFQQRDRETLLQGQLVDIPEEPIDTRHGRRWLHTKKIPIRDAAGVPRFLLGISSDITERRASEEDLRRTHEQLEQRVAERTRELERTQEQFAHAQKLDAIGRLAGGIAHDFNNALAVILGHCALLKGRADQDARVITSIAAIATTAERSARLTRQLLAFSRRQSMQACPTNLNRVVGDARGMLEPLLDEAITLVAALEPELRDTVVDPTLIEQVVVNLVVNARDAMQAGGTLTLRTQNVELAGAALDSLPGLRAGPHVLLCVEDTGHGMAPEVLARAFEPFFTTKDEGRGSGLGLAMAYGVITQSGGAIALHSKVGRGTRVEIYLPAVTHVQAAASATPAPHAQAREGRTVLLVEDQGPFRAVVRDLLVEEGYRVLDAPDGPAALAVASEYSGRIDVLLTDVVMPGMSGPTLAQELTRTRPELRVVLMSGYPSDYLASEASKGRDVRHLAKPFAPDLLFELLRELFAEQARGHAR